MDDEISITYLNKTEKIIKYNSESNKRFNKRIQLNSLFFNFFYVEFVNKLS